MGCTQFRAEPQWATVLKSVATILMYDNVDKVIFLENAVNLGSFLILPGSIWSSKLHNDSPGVL